VGGPPMRRSTERILTTHAGSLPNLSEPPPSDGAQLSAAVTDAVSRQRQIGLDLDRPASLEVYRDNAYYGGGRGVPVRPGRGAARGIRAHRRLGIGASAWLSACTRTRQRSRTASLVDGARVASRTLGARRG
ncbi:MAG: hypothetical protein ACXVRX_11990, partial [Solirubrobacteraceae bacterium]